MAVDPVCGMEVEETTAQWTSEYEGVTYYFCAPGCKASFEADPAKYAANGQDKMEHDPGHEGHDHDHDHEQHAH